MTVHRVVNIVERRSPKPRPVEFDRGYIEDEWYGGSRNYPEGRGCHGEGSYLPSDRRYFDDDPNFGNFRRGFSPQQNVRQVCCAWLFNTCLSIQWCMDRSFSAFNMVLMNIFFSVSSSVISSNKTFPPQLVLQVQVVHIVFFLHSGMPVPPTVL